MNKAEKLGLVAKMEEKQKRVNSILHSDDLSDLREAMADEHAAMDEVLRAIGIDPSSIEPTPPGGAPSSARS